MNKIKSFLLLFALPLLVALSSCQPNSELGYTVITGPEAISRLVVTVDDTFKTAYNQGEKFDITGLSVSFDGILLTRAVDDTPTATQYYLTTSQTTPVAAAFGLESTMNSATKTAEVSFYIAYSPIFTSSDESVNVFVSDPLICTVTNPTVPDQWVVYLVLGIAVVAIAIYSSLRQKRIRENKKSAPKPAKFSPLDQEIVDDFPRENNEDSSLTSDEDSDTGEIN